MNLTHKYQFEAEREKDMSHNPYQSIAEENKSSSKKAKDAFRTISEVADLLGVQQHVLRFWETKFSQVRPMKRGGGRRYYRPEDIELLQVIHKLLHVEGYTIKGVQKLLREQGKNAVIESTIQGQTIISPAPNPYEKTPEKADVPDSGHYTAQATHSHPVKGSNREILTAMLGELRELRAVIAKGA